MTTSEAILIGADGQAIKCIAVNDNAYFAMSCWTKDEALNYCLNNVYPPRLLAEIRKNAEERRTK